MKKHHYILFFTLVIYSATTANPRIFNTTSAFSPNASLNIEIRTNLDRNITRLEKRQLNDPQETIEISIFMFECNPSQGIAYVDTTINFESNYPEEVLILLYLDSTSCGFNGQITLADSLRLIQGKPVGIKNLNALDTKVYPTFIESNFKIEPEFSRKATIKVINEQGEIVKTFIESANPFSINELPSGIYFVVIEERKFIQKILKK